jgi:hypothetical protein
MKTTTEANEALTQLGFTLTHDIPAGLVQDGWPCISYNVALHFKGKPVLETPYRMGVGHVDITKAAPDAMFMNWSQDEQSMIYTWQRNRGAQFKDKQRQANIAEKLARKQGVEPELADVLQSLLMDGQAFFNAQSFEDWADDFGYDKDSRQAEAIYRQCDAIGRKLSAALPKEIIEQAREFVQDL